MFEGLFNKFTEDEIDFISAVKAEQPKYKFKPEREDPYSLNVLRSNMDQQIYSDLIFRNMVTLNDACEHASIQVHNWAKEDKAELRRLQNQRYQLKKKQNSIDSHPDIIAAKIDLETKIQQRKEAIEQWDLFILNAKHKFNELRIQLRMQLKSEGAQNDQSK